MRNMLPRVSTTLGLAMAVFASDPCTAAQPTLRTLVSFNGNDGSRPLGGLIGDGNGNLVWHNIPGRGARCWHSI